MRLLHEEFFALRVCAFYRLVPVGPSAAWDEVSAHEIYVKSPVGAHDQIFGNKICADENLDKNEDVAHAGGRHLERPSRTRTSPRFGRCLDELFGTDDTVHAVSRFL